MGSAQKKLIGEHSLPFGRCTAQTPELIYQFVSQNSRCNVVVCTSRRELKIRPPYDPKLAYIPDIITAAYVKSYKVYLIELFKHAFCASVLCLKVQVL